MPNNALKIDYLSIKDAITMAEAQRLWGKRYNTLRYAIDANNIAAKQVGRAWIVSYTSARRRWGEPKNR